MDVEFGSFVWDADKEARNIEKHGIGFRSASRVFNDPRRKILEDATHSHSEAREYCVGSVKGQIITVRYVVRDGRIRIFGAGYWRKGRDIYNEA